MIHRIKQKAKNVLQAGPTIKGMSNKIRRSKEPICMKGTYFYYRERRASDEFTWQEAVDMRYKKMAESGRYTMNHPLVVRNPFRIAPMTAMVIVTTKEVCSVSATVKGQNGGRDWTMSSSLGHYHRVPVFGLYADVQNTVRLTAKNESGNICGSKEINIQGAKLPAWFQNAVKVISHTKKSCSPYTLVFGGDGKYPYVFDEQGVIRYFLKRQPRSYGLIPMSDGRYWFMDRKVCMPSFSNPLSSRILEMDWWGRTHVCYQIQTGVHHDACEAENGRRVFAASSELAYSTENSIIEIERKTGKIIDKVCLEQILPDLVYSDGIDWAHINTVSYIPEDDSVLICSRNVHSVIKINWKTKKLQWIFGPVSFWKKTQYAEYVIASPSDTWFYQPHAAYCVKKEKDVMQLMIYDNHVNKRHPVDVFDGKKESSVKFFTINETVKTATMIHKFDSEMSGIRSNGVWNQEKNRVFVMSGYLDRKIEDSQGAVYEYDYQEGTLLNHYETKYSYYRAYPFSPCEETLCSELANRVEIIGEYEPVQSCDKSIVENALPMPSPIPDEERESKPERMRKGDIEKRWKKEKAATWKEEQKKYIGDIVVSQERNCLIVRGRDHLVQEILLSDGDNAFRVDYSYTDQQMPYYFAEFVYGIVMNLNDVPKGKYKVYLKCLDQVYDAGFRALVL